MSDLAARLDEAAGNPDESWAKDIDFSGTDENIPVGWYPVKVKGSKMAPSKSSGEDLVTVATIIQEGTFKGRYLYLRLSLSKKALWKTRKTLKALGHEIAADGSFRIGPATFEDAEFEAEVTAESSEFGSIENVRIAGPTDIADL